MYEQRVVLGIGAKRRITVKPQEKRVEGKGAPGTHLSGSRHRLDLAESPQSIGKGKCMPMGKALGFNFDLEDKWSEIERPTLKSPADR